MHETGKKPSGCSRFPTWRILGAVALLVFGPEQLPRVARKAGNVMREIQNTSQSFIREMERAADLHEAEEARAKEPPPYEPSPYDPLPHETLAHDDAPTVAFPAIDGPAPAPEPPAGNGRVAGEAGRAEAGARALQPPRIRRHRASTRRTSERVSAYGGTPPYRSTAAAPALYAAIARA